MRHRLSANPSLLLNRPFNGAVAVYPSFSFSFSFFLGMFFIIIIDRCPSS